MTPGTSQKLLVADDQIEILELVKEIARSRSFEVDAFQDPKKVLAGLGKDPGAYAMAILDFDFGHKKMNGLELLRKVKELVPELPVIILSGEGTISRAVEAIKAGATDWIEKDFDLQEKLEVNLEKAVHLLGWLDELRRVKASNRELKARVDFYQEEFYKKYRMVGQSTATREVLEQVERLAPIPRPVLVRGERGTGKELVAAAIHQASPRRKGPFVTLNCAALSEGLLECEVFGQEENAFNNAPFRRGRFELAHKGTLFLDEIGNMPFGFQQKILRVLEYQTFERVGGSATIQVDVRVVAATNSDLEREMEAGRFRRDLYDRLAFEQVRLPPLRERREDIPALAAHFLRLIADEVPGIEPELFEPEAEARLAGYAWPGNVRELKYFVERVAYRTRRKAIREEDLPPLPGPEAPAVEGDPGTFEQRVSDYKRKLVQDALASSGGDRLAAARKLAMTVEELDRLSSPAISRSSTS